MKGKIYLLLCFHNHQPVGNFDHVIEDAYQKAYHPFLKMLAGYPEIKVTLHYSGYLLNWIAKRKDDFMSLLSKLVERGQVEILGGGMYEPVLPLLAERDRAGQIEKMADTVRMYFGRKPRGIWLAERVWEPELAMTLKRARVEYLPLDDFHFVKGGCKKGELTGYFINEYNGHAVKVFPGLESLRYTIPFEKPDVTINFLKGLAAINKNSSAAVFADDGEKLGVWPGTYGHVYDDGWLKKFFESLIHNREWLTTATFGEYAEIVPPRGRVYLPNASYPEMGEWCLPPDKAEKFGKLLKKMRAGELDDMKDFLHGGHFRNFLAKYEESNQMHKRMLLISQKVERAKSAASSAEIDVMEDSLFRGQNNDPYWHGVFGGLYLPHLRDSVYRNLLRAEKHADRIIRKDKRLWTSVLRGDINRDGEEEVLMNNPKVSLIVHPGDGVSLSELSFVERGFNALNVLTRRRESYHHGIAGGQASRDTTGGTASIHDSVAVKEGVTVQELVFDEHILRSFRDEVYEAGSTTADILNGMRSPLFESARVRGAPFCMVSDEKGALKVQITNSGSRVPLDLEKTIYLEGGREEIRAKIRLINRGDAPFSCKYGNVWNVNFLAPDSDDRYFVSFPVDCGNIKLGESGTVSGVYTFGIHDGWQKFRMFFEGKREGDVIFSPIETFSLSESGIEKVYQGSRIVFLYSLEILPGKFEEVEMRIFLENV